MNVTQLAAENWEMRRALEMIDITSPLEGEVDRAENPIAHGRLLAARYAREALRRIATVEMEKAG